MVPVLPFLEIIHAEIARQGPIPFSRFMELALYHPQFGYYRQPTDPFGRQGDFYTAEQLQPVFGELIRTFVAQRAGNSMCPVVELGAGRRELAAALSEWPYAGFDLDSANAPEPISGIVIANEFFDALPVRLLRKAGGGWQELMVGWRERVLFQARTADHELVAYAEKYGRDLPLGTLLEYNTGLERWVREAARILKRGAFLVIDYGYARNELARFPEGSLMSYAKHVSDADVLYDPGQRDITAHVNFDELRRVAAAEGFVVECELTMRDWALKLLQEGKLKQWWESADQRCRLQWKQIVFGMGETFRVLVLTK